MEKESIELKQQAKKNLRKSLIENEKFDADIIEYSGSVVKTKM